MYRPLRGAWIETLPLCGSYRLPEVSPPTGGVD